MKLFSILVLTIIGGTALGDHEGTTTATGGQKSVEQAKASLSDVARQVQHAGIARIYDDLGAVAEPTVDRYEKREKILRGLLKLAKSQDLEDLKIEGIQFGPGKAIAAPTPNGLPTYTIGEDAAWEDVNKALLKAPKRETKDPNRAQAKRIEKGLGDDVYLTSFHVGPEDTKKIYDIVEKLQKEGLRLKPPVRTIGVSEDYGNIPSIQETGGDRFPCLIIPPQGNEAAIRKFFDPKK